MRTISVALAAHLAGSTTSLATLWKVTRTDGQIFGFTDHDQDLSIGGVTYRSATGFTRSAVRATLGLSEDNVEFSGAIVSTAIKIADIRAGLWDYAVVEVFMVNWNDLTMGTLQMSKGKMGQIRDGRNSFVAEVMGLSGNLRQPVGRLYTAACDADLGDSRCTVNMAPFTFTGAITSVTSRRIFADSGRGEADDYFNAGKITWTSGENSGLSMEVKEFTNAGGGFVLQMPMPYQVQVGDTYSVKKGCLKTFAMCVADFANGENFRGFPHIPGNRQVLSGGI